MLGRAPVPVLQSRGHLTRCPLATFQVHEAFRCCTQPEVLTRPATELQFPDNRLGEERVKLGLDGLHVTHQQTEEHPRDRQILASIQEYLDDLLRRRTLAQPIISEAFTSPGAHSPADFTGQSAPEGLGGRADEVVGDVLDDPGLFEVVFRGMTHDDPLIRMRAVDVVEKVTCQQSELLEPFRGELLELAEQATQQEVRWHVALMLPRVALNARERRKTYAILLRYLDDNSGIVRTNAMQALADLALRWPSFRTDVVPLLGELTRDGTPAMRSRGRKLLARLARG